SYATSASPEVFTLSLRGALPICGGEDTAAERRLVGEAELRGDRGAGQILGIAVDLDPVEPVDLEADPYQRRHRLGAEPAAGRVKSEEHTSELQSPYDLVCRLLLE